MNANMVILKIALGFLALAIAWSYIFQKKFIFQINAWMREYVFSDQVALFSGRRVAVLLLILGSLALFSGLQSIIQVQPIKPNIAAQMLSEAHKDFREKKYLRVVNRCRALVRVNPDSAEAWELLVESWWVMGEKSKAREAAKVLLRLQPDHPFGKSSFHDEMEKMKKEKE